VLIVAAIGTSLKLDSSQPDNGRSGRACARSIAVLSMKTCRGPGGRLVSTAGQASRGELATPEDNCG
jgi:hypothetical protein